MQSGSMNKLARPDCSACEGRGKVRVARSFKGNGREVAMPPAQGNAPGFCWIVCDACHGEGKR